MQELQTHQTSWQGIPLSVTISEPWTSYREVMGYPLIHLAVRASQPLPISETGRTGAYVSGPVLDEWGGPPCPTFWRGWTLTRNAGNGRCS